MCSDDLQQRRRILGGDIECVRWSCGQLPVTRQLSKSSNQRDDRLAPVVFLVAPFLVPVVFMVPSFLAVAVFLGAAFFVAARSRLTAGRA